MKIKEKRMFKLFSKINLILIPAFLIAFSTLSYAGPSDDEEDQAVIPAPLKRFVSETKQKKSSSKRQKSDSIIRSKEKLKPISSSSDSDSEYRDEDFEEQKPHKKKHSKKKRKVKSHNHQPSKLLKKEDGQEAPKFSINKFMGIPDGERRPNTLSPLSDLSKKDDSDEENEDEDVCRYSEDPIPTLADVIKKGTKLKLLANVYLGNIDHLGNIFFPQYELEIKQPDGKIIKGKPHFFRTPKNEICAFASGGTQNAWEKTVTKVYEIFFGIKVKIIRAHWMEKHLKKDKNITKRISKKFEGRETELHSEFYYDLFFRHFFFPDLLKKHKKPINKLSINAFSWWEVCDPCNLNYLEKHKNLCHNNGVEGPIYNIAATRRYTHSYPPDAITGYRVQQDQEKKAWDQIWGKLNTYVDKYPENTEEKLKFWTETPEGLELCKWIGQAFGENLHTPEGKEVIPAKKGDILSFYEKMTPEKKEGLVNLINYLRDKNWDLSCWYKPLSYYREIQKKWKRQAMQIVMPHFNWEVLREYDVEYGKGQCEMCGNKKVHHMALVYHPKQQISKKTLELTDADNETPYEKLTESMKKKRRQSLVVGSKCIKYLQRKREDVDVWREKHSAVDATKKLEALNTFQKQNEDTDKNEAKELYNWMRDETRGKEKATLKHLYILKNSNWNDGKNLKPLIEILIQKHKINKLDKNTYEICKKR